MAPILSNARQQLNPVVTVGALLVAAIRAHEDVSAGTARSRAADLLHDVGIPDAQRRLDAYPHELSGGMAQRVCIALALAHNPVLIVADEPTHGLDVTIQRQVLDLMAVLVHDRDAAQLIATRELGIVAHYCTHVTVIKDGRIVESGPTVRMFASPQSDYTRGLVAAAKLAIEGV